jgi:hypothetical protein
VCACACVREREGGREGECVESDISRHHTRQYEHTVYVRLFLATCFGSLGHHQVSDFYIQLYSTARIPYIGRCLHVGILVSVVIFDAFYVKSYQVTGVLYPSTQRHYCGLILLLILLHVSVVRPSSNRKYISS